MLYSSAKRPPTSTYRLQVRSGLTLEHIRGLVDYFDALGIGSLYLSPLFRATAESSHGYDIVDPTEIDPRVGSLETLTALSKELADRGMGLVLDVVPNHMSTSPTENRWWRDVLEKGERSPFARFFDIDWHPSDEELEGKIVIPALPGPLSDALREAKLCLTRSDLGFSVASGPLSFPLALESWKTIFQTVEGNEAIQDALSAIDSILQRAMVPLDHEAWRRVEDKKKTLLSKLEMSPELAASVDRHLQDIERGNVEILGDLLDHQYYHLSDWREANERLNYRRFFDINDLVGLRVEDPAVFEATHRLVFSLLERGTIQGLRLDHIDGLRDPADYLQKLSDRTTYIVVEKILESDEPLRDWPVAGTTGYETLNSIQELFVYPDGFRELTHLHRDFTGLGGSFEDAVYESKKTVLESSFGAEVAWLAEKIAHINHEPVSSVRHAVIELVACFPVYRTYVSPAGGVVEARDRETFETALSAAKSRNPLREDLLFEGVASLLALENPSSPGKEPAELRGEIVARFQQLTGPAMAKGVEDTAFYRYYPLVSLNEVGGGGSHLDELDEFHERNSSKAQRWPTGLTATSTHDTKRDEDVRSRIHVLSEDADGWREATARWREQNRGHRRLLPSGEAPDGSEEYLFYQTLLGSWPMEPMDASSHLQYVERVQGFMLKAMREAKRNTNWIEPDTVYEAAVLDFIARVLDRDESTWFLGDFARYEASVRRAGLLNALSQLLLKATVPGVPDFYQGTESFRLSLVDPDNRRPVDFEARRRELTAIDEELRAKGHAAFVRESMNHLEDGRLKFHWTRVLCRLRRERATFFREAGYRPIVAEGERGEHVIAFARTSARDTLIVAAGRWFQRLGTPAPTTTGDWRNTSLRLDGCEAKRYREILSEGVLTPEASGDVSTLSLGEVFRHAPLALLEPVEG